MKEFINTRIIKFGFVGIVSMFINEISLYLLTNKIGIVYFISVIFSFQLSVIFNFITHSRFTFKEIKLDSHLKSFYKYELAIPLVFITNYIALILLVEGMNINYLIANFIGICLAFIVHYNISKRVIWSAKK